MSHITISLPLPPQTKERPKVSTRGRFARAYYTPKYETWKDTAKLLLEEYWAGLPPIPWVRKLSIFLWGDDAGAGDVEGLFGATADAMVAAKVIKNDGIGNFVHLEAKWHRCDNPGEESTPRIEIVLELPEPDEQNPAYRKKPPKKVKAGKTKQACLEPIPAI